MSLGFSLWTLASQAQPPRLTWLVASTGTSAGLWVGMNSPALPPLEEGRVYRRRNLLRNHDYPFATGRSLSIAPGRPPLSPSFPLAMPCDCSSRNNLSQLTENSFLCPEGPLSAPNESRCSVDRAAACSRTFLRTTARANSACGLSCTRVSIKHPTFRG